MLSIVYSQVADDNKFYSGNLRLPVCLLLDVVISVTSPDVQYRNEGRGKLSYFEEIQNLAKHITIHVTDKG
jgi:hypothetical protein